jgi:hypothetical protein
VWGSRGLVSEPCMDVVALFIKRGESLFRERE